MVYASPRPDEAAALLSKPDGWPDITEEVADIRFSAIEGFDEATRQQVWKLEAKYPGHPEVAALVAEVAAEDSAKAEVARAEAKAAAAPRAVTPPESAAVPTPVDPAEDSLSSLPPASPSPSTPPALLTPVDGPPPLGRFPVSRTDTDGPADLGPAVTGRTAPPVMPTEAVTGRTVVPSDEPPRPMEHRGDSDDTPVGLELPSLVTTPAVAEVDENLETSDALLTVDTAGFDELDDDDDEPPTLDPAPAEVPVEAPPALGLRPRRDGPVFEDSLSFGARC